MDAEARAKITAKLARGEVKEALGRATGDKFLEAEGHVDQAQARAEQQTEDIADRFRL